MASETNLESCQISKMSHSEKNSQKNETPFTIFAKCFILGIWQSSEYASELASRIQKLANIIESFQNIFT